MYFHFVYFSISWMKHNGHEFPMKLLVWCLFLMGFSFWLQNLLVLLRDDVEVNRGPKRTSKASLSICHWNLNSTSAHNYIKLSLLRAYLVFHKFDIIYLSETYLISSNSPDGETLETSGYNLERLTIRVTVNVEEFAFTIKTTYPYELSLSIIYQNVKFSK